VPRYSSYIIVVLCFFYSLPSFALAKLGHQLVCQLAFEHLSNRNQKKIILLLGTIPLPTQQHINRYNRVEKNTPISFSNACTWADAIKKEPIYKKYKTWHYMNIPRSYSFIPKNSCLNNCLPQAIIQHQKLLSAKKAMPLYSDVITQTTAQSTQNSVWIKAKALMFLGHWLGDIHQPLHISYASDLGGNKISLKKKQGHCDNLHSYWDHCILSLSKLTKAEWLAKLTSKWSEIVVPSYKEDHVWHWANESYQTIIQPSFQYCNVILVQDQQKLCQRPSGKVTLADNYHDQHLPLLALQLVKAAKRLTSVLEASL